MPRPGAKPRRGRPSHLGDSHTLTVRVSGNVHAQLVKLAGERQAATGERVGVSDIVRKAIERELKG
ncbi:MAG: hypothetical protein AAGI11_06350 [Pseudomonadota bacterium]